MREAFRDDRPLRLPLERVVADRLGGAHAFLDVTGLKDVALRVARVGGPHAGVAVGLELDNSGRAQDPRLPGVPLSALNAAGCRSSSHRGPMTRQDRAEGVTRALRTPGSFYSITANSEGMIVVDPNAGLAWLLYFG